MLILFGGWEALIVAVWLHLFFCPLPPPQASEEVRSPHVGPASRPLHPPLCFTASLARSFPVLASPCFTFSYCIIFSPYNKNNIYIKSWRACVYLNGCFTRGRASRDSLIPYIQTGLHSLHSAAVSLLYKCHSSGEEVCFQAKFSCCCFTVSGSQKLWPCLSQDQLEAKKSLSDQWPCPTRCPLK